MDGKIARDGPVKEFVSCCREILLNFLNNHFPVMREFPVMPGVAPPADMIQYDDWSLRARNMLIQFANQLQLPDRYGVLVE